MSTIVQLPYSAFDVRTISDCVLWLDAWDSSTVTGTTSVTQWRDKSGNARHLGVGSGTTSYSSNAIVLASSFMSVTSAVDLSSFSFFIVGLSPGAQNNQSVFVARPSTTPSYNTTDGLGYYMDAGSPRTRLYGTSAGIVTNNRTISSRYMDSYTGTNAGLISSWVNGVTSNTATTAARTNTAQGFAIGGEWGGSSYVNLISVANINEIILFNRVLSTSERQAIEGYLGSKWGLLPNTPTSHPFRPGIALRPFQPPDVGPLSLWLDSADRSTITLSNTSVTAWRDKSSNAYSFTGAAGGYPTYSNSLNGLPVVSSATGQRLSNTTWATPATTMALFIVMRPTQSSGGANGNWLITQYGSGQLGFQLMFSYANAVNQYYQLNMFAAQTSSSGQWILQSTLSNTSAFNAINQPLLMTMNIVANSHFLRYNGVNTSNNVAFGPNFGLQVSSGVTLFVAGAADNSSLGYDLAELITYNGTLSVAQMRQVEGYLATKWRVSTNIPTTEPYYNLRTLPATPLFIPTTIGGCALWLDGADASTVTGTTTVTQWSDKSGSGRNATAATNSPSYTSRTGIAFNGTSQYMSVTSSSSMLTNTAFTVFIVETLNAVPTTSTGLFFGDSTLNAAGATNSTLHIGYLTTSANLLFGFYGNDITDTGVTTAGTRRLWTFRCQASVNRNIRRNGGSVIISAGNSTKLTNFTQLVIGGFVFGANSTPGYYNGTLHEVVVYGDLSDIQVQQVEGYLSWKWGLQTQKPTSHPFRNFRA